MRRTATAIAALASLLASGCSRTAFIVTGTTTLAGALGGLAVYYNHCDPDSGMPLEENSCNTDDATSAALLGAAIVAGINGAFYFLLDDRRRAEQQREKEEERSTEAEETTTQDGQEQRDGANSECSLCCEMRESSRGTGTAKSLEPACGGGCSCE